jgi:hypothetical protein
MEIEVKRTLVKSEPELRELIEADPLLGSDRVRIRMAEKGFGTRVTITVSQSAGLGEPDLEQLLDSLAEPQKRPFSAG